MSEIYSGLKVFRFADKITALSQDIWHSPVHVRIKPTNACNHKCWFCAYRVDGLDLGANMRIADRIPETKMSEIVSDLIEMKVQAVTFSGGGEPLIYPGIANVVRRLGEGGVKVATLTNGTFLRGDVADAFAQYGTWVRVSMDTWDGESHRHSRGAKPEEYEQILENMRLFFSKKSKCVLGVHFVITEHNASRIYDFCRQIKAVGVRHVKLSACVVSNLGEETNQYHNSIKDVVSEQVKLAMALCDSKFEIVNHYHLMETCFDKSYTQCWSGRMLTIIGADSKIYFCQDKAYTDSGYLGSIQNQSFQQAWNSEELKANWHALDPSVACRHHCVSDLKNRTLNEFVSLDPDHAAFV